MADNRICVTAELIGDDYGTDWLQLRGNRNFFDVSVGGNFTATIHLQRKRPAEDEKAVRDVESYTSPVEKLGEMQGHWDVRLYIKTGNYLSGAVKAELGT